MGPDRGCERDEKFKKRLRMSVMERCRLYGQERVQRRQASETDTFHNRRRSSATRPPSLPGTPGVTITEATALAAPRRRCGKNERSPRSSVALPRHQNGGERCYRRSRWADRRGDWEVACQARTEARTTVVICRSGTCCVRALRAGTRACRSRNWTASARTWSSS